MTTATRRILYLSTDMGMGGGAEDQIIRMAYAMRDRGWGVSIVSLLPTSPMPADFAGRGIELFHLGMRRGLPDPRAIARLVRLIHRQKPVVIHSHLPHPNLLARIVRIIRPFPVLVNTLHALNMSGVEHDHGAILEFAHQATDRLCDRTTAICQAAARNAIDSGAVPASKMVVIYNGIDSQRYRHDPQARARLRREMTIDVGQFVWMAAGRLEAPKAYPTMLRAFAQYRNFPARKDDLLLICGQGSLKDELILLAQELGIGQNARFQGLRSDIPDVMSAADGFVLSSDLEGLPLVLLQASAAGLPIVATDVAGNPEAVVHGLHGYLVPPGDPEQFSRQMLRVASLSPAERKKMGDAGAARVRQLFEAERIADQWEGLYVELLDAVGGAGGRSGG